MLSQAERLFHSKGEVLLAWDIAEQGGWRGDIPHHALDARIVSETTATNFCTLSRQETAAHT